MVLNAKQEICFFIYSPIVWYSIYLFGTSIPVFCKNTVYVYYYYYYIC